MHSSSLSLLSSLPLKLSIINPCYPHTLKHTISIKPVNCSRSSSNNNNEAVSGMVDELLKREENRELLNGLNEATRRVERAREAMAEIERREAEAARANDYVAQLESRKLEIEKSQRELLEARSMVDEAQRALSSNMDENSFEDAPSEQVNKDIERLESVKAASVSAIIGTLASLPISLYQDTSFVQLSFHLAIIFFSCALFGVTYRHIVRRDLDDIHLKTGASAAFGLVKGLAALGAGNLYELDIHSLISYSIDGAVYVSQSVFIFLSASIALDFCFKTKLLSPFPMREVK